MAGNSGVRIRMVNHLGLIRVCSILVVFTWLIYAASVVLADRDPVTAFTELARWMDVHGL
jgi:hypothetical protein